MICPHCGHDNLPGNENCTNCLQDLTPLDRPIPHTSVERTLMEDPVKKLQSPEPITVLPSTTIKEVIRVMMDCNIGAVLVVDQEGKLLGIFSERDLLKKIAGIHSNLEDLPVNDFMTPNPETVQPTDRLNFALHRMDIGGYRHLPVVEKGKPTGIFSVRDMLRHLTAYGRER